MIMTEKGLAQLPADLLVEYFQQLCREDAVRFVFQSKEYSPSESLIQIRQEILRRLSAGAR